MSTKLYLEAYLHNVWEATAHLRKRSMPMAIIVAILMNPTFAQDLYHYRIFNADALIELVSIFLMWMGAALSIQCLNDYLFCKRSGWTISLPLYMGLFVAIASMPWNVIGPVTLILLTSIIMYEVGFHSLQLIKEGINQERYEVTSTVLKTLCIPSYIIIIIGIIITLNIALRTGHLL